MIEYEIKKPSGKVKIVVDVRYEYGTACYRVCDVLTCAKGKRKWLSTASLIRDRYDYRSLDFDEKSDFAKSEYLKICTEDDIAAALRTAYEKMKPTERNTTFRVF